MTLRRNILIGAACFGALGAAEYLRPRRRVSLMGKQTLAGFIPLKFGDWETEEFPGLVRPKEDNSLSDLIYQETLARAYRNQTTNDEVMVLIAHGDSQSDLLQLHRPETCYPAFGFQLSLNNPTSIKLSGGGSIPARRLVADVPGRRESIIYWTRLGEYLPDTGEKQRVVRLKMAMDGYVADGTLARFSALGSDPETEFAVLERFIPALLQALPAPGRRALIGSKLTGSMPA